MVYEELFSCAADVFDEFRVPEKEQEGVKILYAIYTDEDYSGSASVIFVRNGKFWFVTGGHCSCHGLEDQWDPEEITADQIRHYVEHGVAPYGVDFEKVEKIFDVFEGMDLRVVSDDQIAVLIKLAIG